MKFSSSSLSDAAICLKKFEYRHKEHLILKPHLQSQALRRGIHIHKALEEHHRGRDWRRPLWDMRDWATEHGIPDDEADALMSECCDIMEGYVDYWGKMWPDEPWEAVAAEEALTAETPAGDTLQATIDTLVRTKRGLFIVEHKSTGQFPNAAWRAIDPQTALQYFLAKLNGIEVDGIIFNYLLTKKPPVPQVKKDGEFYARDYRTTTLAFERALPEVRERRNGNGDVEAYITESRARMVFDGAYYQRYTVYKPEDTVVEIIRDDAQVIRNIKAAEEAGRYPRTIHRLTCELCPYAEVCSAELVLGREAPGIREQSYAIESAELRAMGRDMTHA